jgi:hypothetical protein
MRRQSETLLGIKPYRLATQIHSRALNQRFRNNLGLQFIRPTPLAI